MLAGGEQKAGLKMQQHLKGLLSLGGLGVELLGLGKMGAGRVSPLDIQKQKNPLARNI